MRALLVGIGGAGCRIVNVLNSHDLRSGVKSVRSYVFDADLATMTALESIDTDKRVMVSPRDLSRSEWPAGKDFDVGNLASCFQDSGVDEIDGIFVCAGLGGRMAELVPEFIAQLAAAFPDPVFAILTLPGRSEGVRISARAARTFAEIREVCSASIVFDNETWMARIERDRAAASAKEAGVVNGGKDGAKPVISEMYGELNEILARRVGLLLRAGEMTHNGVESAEVVLDAGEVLNTLTGMDVVSIGYATEKLPSDLSGILKKFRVEKYLLDEGHKRTARIVELAKRAVYEEVSVPCDLTSANKALVLIAGPSNELSMKGFQTVRKWIDRSIRGLEMRAGDYPVKSTRYVGVIIVLAGIENVPRIVELDEIAESYEAEMVKVYSADEMFEAAVVPLIEVASDEAIFEQDMVMANETGAGAGRMFLPPPDFGGGFGMSDNDMNESKYDMQYSDDDNDDDLFEDEPVFRQREQPSQPPRQPQRERERMRVPEPRKRDPQISAGASRKPSKKIDETIPLPRREERCDGVLAGMADVGGKDMPREAESRVMAGSSMRPKETDGHVRMAGTQRPKETDGHVRMTGGQRPKEIGDEVRVAGKKKQTNDDTTGTKKEFRWL